MELSSEAKTVISRVEKLLALAGNNPNENEAQAATAKAMELLATYNLDMAMVGATAKGAQRSDKSRKGGLYQWQRDVWKWCAELNFCTYFSIRGLKAGSTYQHRIVGRHENVISTELMAGYLQDAIERLAQEWARPIYTSVFVREAIAYREGMAVRICERLRDLRRERLRTDEGRKRNSTEDTSRALVLQDVVTAEADLNNDYLKGWEPGTTARKRAEQEEAARQWHEDYLRRMRERDEREEADPALKAERLTIEAKAEAAWAAAQQKAARRAAKRQPSVPRPRADSPSEARSKLHAFSEGYAKGNDVNLDKQIDRHPRPVLK